MYELQLLTDKLALVDTTNTKIKPIIIDFCTADILWRCRPQQLAQEAIATAIGLKKYKLPLSVIDATAGLGTDAFILAALGCTVTLIERSPMIATLLQDGLKRAGACIETVTITNNMQLLNGDSADIFATLPAVQHPDIIYLDPMFPKRHKTALVKKEMIALQNLVGSDADSHNLLKIAMSIAKKRIVVKRPRLAPHLANVPPSFAITGRVNRFDVYVCKNT